MHRVSRPEPLAAAFAVLLLAAPTATASEGGIVLWPDLPMLLVMMALFALLLVPVNALLFRPLLRALDLRVERTVGTRSRAEKLAASADEILARYEQAVADVRVEAEQMRRAELASARSETSARTAQARAEAEQEIERARREVAGELAAARTRLRVDVEPLGREAASRVLGRAVS
jgi:F0F1-type ATP synthase membrane subunit b/b'